MDNYGTNNTTTPTVSTGSIISNSLNGVGSAIGNSAGSAIKMLTGFLTPTPSGYYTNSSTQTSTPQAFIPALKTNTPTSVTPTIGQPTTSQISTPQSQLGTVTQGKYGTIQNINGGIVYSDPRDNPNYIKPPTNYTPQNFSVTSGSNGSIPSTSLNTTGMTEQGLINKNNANITGLTNGTNTTGIPSDGLLGQVAQNVYNSSLYTPEEQTQIQNLSDINSRISATQLAARRQIQQMQEDGSITKDQATAFLSEAQRRSDQQLADLSVAKDADTNTLSTLGLLRGNNLTANQNLASLLQPTQVSPGSTLYNPITGVQYQGTGASPAQINSTALQYAQLAIQNGSVQTNPDGTINMQPYIQQAQAMYGGQPSSSVSGTSQAGVSQSGVSSTSTGAVPIYGQDGSVSTSIAYQGQPQGQPQGFGANGYGNIQALPQNLQQYVQKTAITDSQGNVTNLPFIDSTRIPAALQASAQANAAAAGIPYLDSTGTNAVFAAQQIIDIANAAEALSIRNLGSGATGRISNTLLNWANNFLQFNPDLSNFAQLRDAASKATTALSGGVGSGFRMNMGIIDAAVQNLPTANDNLETALTKTDALRGQIINAMSPLFPQVGGGQIFSNSHTASNPTGTTSSSGNSQTSNSDWASLGD